MALCLPTLAWAQAAIAGEVRDTSGAVLPGVTVEASSPALIEKVRTAITDGNGRYRIEDLRPGTYVVTFTLSGFTTTRREGLNVSGTGVITIDIEMPVGGVQETITVTGETPVVDVPSTRREITLDNETMRNLPSGAQLQLPADHGARAADRTSPTSTPARCSRSSRCTAAAASSRASPSRG